MRIGRRHAALLLAALSAGIILITLFVIDTSRNNGTIELVDLLGDRSALDGIAVEGAIRDGYHEMRFRWADGRITKQTKVHDEPRNLNTYYAPGMPLPVGDRFYEIYPSFTSNDDYEVRYFDNIDGFRGDFGGMAFIDPSLVYHSAANSRAHTNYQEKGLAFIGDRVFYAPTTTRDYTGSSGIYEVIRFSGRNTMQGEDSEQPATKRIAELDLEGNSRDELQGLEVLGLEAVDGKLALIALVDGRIVVRGFDADSGEIIGEAALDTFVHTTTVEGGQRPDGETYRENYDAYADDDTGILTLKLTSTNSTSLENHLAIISLSLREGVQLVHEQSLVHPVRDAEPIEEYSRFSFRDGKLYAFKRMLSQPPDLFTRYDDLKIRSFFIEAYEAGELIYRGELVTDMNDDLVQEQHLAEPYQFQYEPYRYRQMEDVLFRSTD
ncbi:hypothetical protein [Paenibacillus sp. PL2-23]|uniref:hypothetical protein n=1 Tax=Paenibacillus sp. PL2-23 TaxID=2100729 RepID=UPI0030FBB7A0